jgi:hypothetical protein
MSSFSEYGDFGAGVALVVVVEVVEVEVVEVEVVEIEAASASCMLGTTDSERIRIKTRSDRDFIKTLEAASLRY